MTITSEELDEVFPNNPLREVAFEVRFPFNLRVSNNTYQLQLLFENDYPIIYREEIEMEDGISGIVYVFENADKNQEIKIGEEFLGVTFSHYQSFEVFFNEVIKISRAIFDSFYIKTLTRVGLRYINVIDIENSVISELNKFVLPRLDFSRIDKKPVKGFISEVLFQTEACFLNSRSIFFSGEDKEVNSYVLDIDAYVDNPVNTDNLNEILIKLHYEIQLDFLEHITEQYKQKMRMKPKN